MLADGVHVKVVSEMLGHTDVALNVYAHVLPNLQDEAVRRLDELLA
jgi:site-specific recombinase XerD